MKSWSSSAYIAALLGVLVLCAWVYWPGLQGGFLFDDAPNLSYMGSQGGVQDWSTFKQFVFGGIAGPSGRPVSLASFLLDDFTWPSTPYGFKRTNLLIHLLTGLVLGWATLNLLRLYALPEDRAVWIALLNMSIWLLHPYLVSTTLYVVQRMAQLAALFMFAGLAGYLHGRRQLISGAGRPYVWMSTSLALATGLAVLSKENGALLPVLVLVIEFCLPSGARRMSPDWRWRAVFLWFPTLFIAYKLGMRIDFSSDPWPTRPFNQIERLWSEARILWEYLFHLFVPRIEGRGLFHDGYEISRGWLQPAATLAGALGISALIIAALWLRHRQPLVSLAILFFLAAHLFESTVVALELYFEHRNYVASAFLFLPLAASIIWLAGKISLSLVVAISIAMLGTLAWLTSQRASLWSDSEKLQTYWALATPNSPRAQNYLAVQLFKQGRPNEGMAHLQKSMERLPQSSLLNMQWLLQRVLYGIASEKDFQNAAQRMATQRFDAQAVLGLRMIVEELILPGKSPYYRLWTRELLQTVGGNRRYQVVPVFRRLKPYLEGLLWLADGRVQEAIPQLEQAMDRYADTDAALSIVSHLGEVGYPVEALGMLDKAQIIYARQPAFKLKRTREVYDAEFSRLRSLLTSDSKIKPEVPSSPSSEPVL